MSHLSAERLAALADDEPTTTEGEHLARCSVCARERAAHRALVAMAVGDRETATLPLTRWETLLPALRTEGIARGAEAAHRRFTANSGWMRAAAAVLLVATGVAAGRYSAGKPIVPGVGDAGRDTASQVITSGTDSVPSFQSPTQALAALAQYERAYQAAATYLAANDTAAQPVGREAYEARLATLDQVAEATRQGLQATPYDPVINRYYLTTLGARQATLRQLSASLPSNVHVGGY
jgi:hypothetical protein